MTSNPSQQSAGPASIWTSYHLRNRTLLTTEGEVDPAKLVPVLHYDGTPITARFIAGAIAERMALGQIEAAE